MDHRIASDPARDDEAIQLRVAQTSRSGHARERQLCARSGRSERARGESLNDQSGLKSFARYRATRRAGLAEGLVCPHARSIDANDLGTKDCSSARRNLLIPSTYGLFKSAPRAAQRHRRRYRLPGIRRCPMDHRRYHPRRWRLEPLKRNASDDVPYTKQLMRGQRCLLCQRLSRAEAKQAFKAFAERRKPTSRKRRLTKPPRLFCAARRIRGAPCALPAKACQKPHRLS